MRLFVFYKTENNSFLAFVNFLYVSLLFAALFIALSKAETINEVSKNLSLSNIDSTSKELIRSDLYKIIHTRSYKERFGLFLDSVLNNRTVFIINRIPSNKIATDTNSKSIINIFVSILYSILFVLTSNIFLSLMLIFRINKQPITIKQY